MSRLGWTTAVLLMLSVTPGLVHAGATPAEKCAVTKSKAAAKKTVAKLKCWQKAFATGATTADSDCLATAETKFNAAIAKADAAGGCVRSGDAAQIEHVVDQCVGDIVAATPTVACQAASLSCKCGSITFSTTQTCGTPTPRTCTEQHDIASQNCMLNGQPPDGCDSTPCTDDCTSLTCG